MDRNIIQVFGLPRSGTNFLEWSLNNNFEGLNYKNIYVDYCNTVGLREYKRWNVLKHSYPNLDFSDYSIVIYKTYDAWVESMNKGYGVKGSRGEASKETYDKYLEVANSLPKDKVIVVSFEYTYNNYSELMGKISEMINVSHNENIIRPKNKLDGGGAAVKETNKIFKI